MIWKFGLVFFTITESHDIYESQHPVTFAQQIFPQLISVFTKIGPIRSCDLAALDAYTRHMSHIPSKIYLVAPEGNCRDSWFSDYEFMLSQIRFFTDRGLNADVILVEDLTPWIVNTPLYGKIKHRNISGICGKALHGNTMAHGADVFRLLATYHLGGIYRDTDATYLTDFELYLKRFGINFLTGNGEAERTESQGVTNAMFGVMARSPLLGAALYYVEVLLSQYGPDRVIPPTSDVTNAMPWGMCGPELFDDARKALATYGCIELCTQNVTGLIADYDMNRTIALSELLSQFDGKEYPVNPILRSDCDIYTKRSQSNRQQKSSFNVSIDYAIESSDAECYEKLPPYAAVIRKYHHVLNEAALFTPLQWYYKSPLGLIDNFYVPNETDGRIDKLKKAIGYHWFGYDKGLWPRYIQHTEYNPLIKILRDKSCKHLCSEEDFRILQPYFTATT